MIGWRGDGGGVGWGLRLESAPNFLRPSRLPGGRGVSAGRGDGAAGTWALLSGPTPADPLAGSDLTDRKRGLRGKCGSRPPEGGAFGGRERRGRSEQLACSASRRRGGVEGARGAGRGARQRRG